MFVAQPQAAEPMRLIAFGDSLTAGYGLPPGEGFAPQLQEWLAGAGAPPVTVINAGVSGDTTAGGAARINWTLAEGADAVIVELGANDALRGVMPVETRANLSRILEEIDKTGAAILVTGMIAPLNYGPEYKADFDSLFEELATRHGALYDPFFLEGVAGDPTLNQADGLHPTREGVAKVVERIGPLVLELLERAQAE